MQHVNVVLGDFRMKKRRKYRVKWGLKPEESNLNIFRDFMCLHAATALIRALMRNGRRVRLETINWR